MNKTYEESVWEMYLASVMNNKHTDAHPQFLLNKAIEYTDMFENRVVYGVCSDKYEKVLLDMQRIFPTYWGKRCDEFDEECVVCQMYQAYDLITSNIKDIP